MGYDLKKDKIIIGQKRRIFFKRKNIVSFSYPLVILFGFIMVMSFVAPALAIEVTKASAILDEPGYGAELFYSAPPRPPQKDPCLSFLGSPSHTLEKQARFLRDNRSLTEEQNAPVALAFMLGFRMALDPREVQSSQKSVQLSAKTHRNNMKGNSRALAIAAYRSCKNKIALGRS